MIIGIFLLGVFEGFNDGNCCFLAFAILGLSFDLGLFYLEEA